MSEGTEIKMLCGAVDGLRWSSAEDVMGSRDSLGILCLNF